MAHDAILYEGDYNNFIAYFPDSLGCVSFRVTSFSVKVTDRETNKTVVFPNVSYSFEDNCNYKIKFTIPFGENFLPYKNYNISCEIETILSSDESTFTISLELDGGFGAIVNYSASVRSKLTTDEYGKATIGLDTIVYAKCAGPNIIKLKQDGWLNFEYRFDSNYISGEPQKNIFTSTNLSGMQNPGLIIKNTFYPEWDNYGDDFATSYISDFQMKIYISNYTSDLKNYIYYDYNIIINISKLYTAPSAPVINQISNKNNTSYSSWLQAPSTGVPFISSIPELVSSIQTDISTQPSGKYGARIDHYNFYIKDTLVGTCPYDSSATAIPCTIPSVSVDTDTTFQISAVDTRGEESPKSNAKDIYIFAYGKPQITNIKVNRKNNFEKETTISCNAGYKRLNNLNTVTLKATCSALWTGEKTITTSIDKGSDDNTGYKLVEFRKIFSDSSYSDTSLYTNPGFDIEKSFNVTLTLTDRTGMAVSATCFVPQGVPLFTQTETGINAIGMIPKWDSPCKLQVNSDILAKDSDGNEIEIINAIKNLVKLTTDENEPTQATGSYWIKATEITNTIT